MSSKFTSLKSTIFFLCLISSFTLICNSSKNYDIQFDFPEDDLVYLEPFYDLFEDESDEQINDEDLNDDYYEDEDDEFYYQEDEDNLEDFTYVNNISESKVKKTEENLIKSLGDNYRRLNAKLIVHNSLRDSEIHYSQDVSI